MAREDCRVARAVAVFGGQLLRVAVVEPLEVRLRDGPRSVPVDVLSTTLTGGSAKMLAGGTTIRARAPSIFRRRASPRSPK